MRGSRIRHAAPDIRSHESRDFSRLDRQHEEYVGAVRLNGSVGGLLSITRIGGCWRLDNVNSRRPEKMVRIEHYWQIISSCASAPCHPGREDAFFPTPTTPTSTLPIRVGPALGCAGRSIRERLENPCRSCNLFTPFTHSRLRIRRRSHSWVEPGPCLEVPFASSQRY